MNFTNVEINVNVGAGGGEKERELHGIQLSMTK